MKRPSTRMQSVAPRHPRADTRSFQESCAAARPAGATRRVTHATRRRLAQRIRIPLGRGKGEGVGLFATGLIAGAWDLSPGLDGMRRQPDYRTPWSVAEGDGAVEIPQPAAAALTSSTWLLCCSRSRVAVASTSSPARISWPVLEPGGWTVAGDRPMLECSTCATAAPRFVRRPARPAQTARAPVEPR